MKPRTLMLALLGAAMMLPMTIWAGQEPGYIDLDWITIPDHAAEVQDIDLSGVLESLALEAKQDGDDSMAQALAMIHSVRVKAFSLTDQDLSRAEKAVTKVQKKLKEDHWSRLMYIKDDEESVTVSTKSVDGQMVGLMVVIFDPSDQVLFVNVAGDLNLGTLFRLAQKFGMDDLDALLADSTATTIPAPAD